MRPPSPFLVLFALSALPLAAAPAAPVTPNSPPFDIMVRSDVDKPFGSLKTTEPPDHGKVYYIIAVEEVKRDINLIRRVDEPRLLALTQQELHRRGYREIVQGEVPRLVLTVQYGRGYLRNPYTASATTNESMENALGNSGSNTDFGGGLPSITITGAMPLQLLKQKEPGFESRLQRANLEKLYIRITAWQYPKPKGQKRPSIAWRTTMLMDDPDHADLNVVAPQLLAAGGAYFDRPIHSEEAELRSDLPEGQVNVGTPRVVDSARPK